MRQHCYFNANSSLAPSEIKSILLKTAADKGWTGPDKKYGYGVLDVESTVNMLLSKSDTSASPSSSLDINESNISVTSNENVTVTVISASGLKGEEIKISAKITSPPHQRPMFAKAYLHLDREEEEVNIKTPGF